jgi:predicted DNA-binding transcriptional regulator YafY
LTGGVPSSTSRLLALLETLQAQPFATGRELADRLEVDVRTLRRYIAALQELGIPIEGQRGAGGGYRMRPGYRLPPLMLSDDEAVVVALGLVVAQRLGLDTESAAAGGALAKIHRVLPTRLRGRVEALEAATGFTAAASAGAPVPGEVVLLLADAIRRRRRVRTRYRAFAGEVSRREVSPLGLVVHAGRWYLAAHDHGRGELRTFRVDRMSGPTLEDATAAAPPDGFDAVAYVSSSLASVPWAWEVEVALELPAAEAAERIPATLGGVAEEEGVTILRLRVESLDWTASLLAGLGCGFTIRRPDELRASVAALAESLAAAAG